MNKSGRKPAAFVCKNNASGTEFHALVIYLFYIGAS
jgi:hypothetical protein